MIFIRAWYMGAPAQPPPPGVADDAAVDDAEHEGAAEEAVHEGSAVDAVPLEDGVTDYVPYDDSQD